MLQRTMLGPFELEFITGNITSYVPGPTTIYYHVDSGFAGTCNESWRCWYIDHNDFNQWH